VDLLPRLPSHRRTAAEFLLWDLVGGKTKHMKLPVDVASSKGQARAGKPGYVNVVASDLEGCEKGVLLAFGLACRVSSTVLKR